MPPKKAQKKKAPKKPTKATKKGGKPSAPKPIVLKIISRKGKEPCCTELKTGQGYTVPFGFSSLKGPEPVNLPLNVVPFSDRQRDVVPFSDRQRNVKPIEVQTDEPTTASFSTQTSLSKVPAATKTMEVQTEDTPLTKSMGTLTNISIGKTIAVPTVLLPPPRVIAAPITKKTPEPSTPLVTPASSLVRPSKIPVSSSKPRKNSNLDLEIRYSNATGRSYRGPKLSNKDFRKLVEEVEAENI